MAFGIAKMLLSKLTIYFEGGLWIGLAIEQGCGGRLGALEVRCDDCSKGGIGIGFTECYSLLFGHATRVP
jgi:hypothetical protein